MEDLEQVRKQAEIFVGDLAKLLTTERERSRALEDALDAFAFAFALIVEGNDPDTQAHLRRTTRWATAVAERLDVADVPHLRRGFLLHDIGKWAVDKSILLKAGPLTDAEWKIMRLHPIWGVHMIEDVKLLRSACDVIRHHHERWDGAGYPDGKKGEDIPIGARIFSVADVFDAITEDRPYRTRNFTFDEAIDIIRLERAKQFDPNVVDVFVDFMLELNRETGSP